MYLCDDQEAQEWSDAYSHQAIELTESALRQRLTGTPKQNTKSRMADDMYEIRFVEERSWH